ncbi:MAG: hypothetical protein NTV01_00450 [Bacteroidia bacterium]|nr:hypothetical protein [Bacteroidia bacterium]
MGTYKAAMRSVTATLTRPTNVSPYVAYDVLGTTNSPKSNLIFTVDDQNYPGQSVWLVGARLSINSNELFTGMTAGFLLHLFNDVPLEQTDNAAFALTDAADAAKYLGYITLPTPIDKGVFIYTDNVVLEVPIPFNNTAATLVGQLVTLSSFTPVASSIFTVSLILVTT